MTLTSTPIGIAAFISNPIEVSLVRMQADGRLPLAQQVNFWPKYLWPRSWANFGLLFSCIPTGMHDPTCIF
jgi:hypothetical protein